MSDNVERIRAALAALSEDERARMFERPAGDAGSPHASQTTVPLNPAADELEDPADYIVIFDGGSRGNPGPGYGSYMLVRGHDGKRSLVRLDFGRQMTNNEAKYESLIAGLRGLIERIEAAGRPPWDFAVEIRGDSALVIHQVEGTWRAKDDRMRLLRNRVRELLAWFKAYRFMLQGREETVRVLGH